MPLEGMDNMNKGWDEIFEEIKAFISPDNDTNNNSKSSYDHLKAVFCMPNDITETKFAMDFLYDRFIKNPANKSKCLARATDKVLNLETLVNKLAKVKVIFKIEKNLKYSIINLKIKFLSFLHIQQLMIYFHRLHLTIRWVRVVNGMRKKGLLTAVWVLLRNTLT